MALCNVSVTQKKRRRKVMVRFYLDHMCPPTPFNPHHSAHKYLSSLWPAIPFLSFVFFHFLTNTPSHSPTGTSMPPSPPSFFRQCHQEILRTSKHLHLLFEVKFLILLVSFIFCLRLYFYLSLNNDTYVIYEH